MVHTKRKREWLAAVALCLLVSATAALPFFYIGEDRAVGCCGGEMPITHDAWMHFNQMQAFARGLVAGGVYPRWDDVTHRGYGAPSLSFYPPAAYYLTSFWYLVMRNWRWVWLLTWWTMLFASGLALYAYARESLAHGAALLAMCVYSVLPYHLLNQYQRGALAEQLSFVWMPLCLIFAERLRRQTLSMLAPSPTWSESPERAEVSSRGQRPRTDASETPALKGPHFNADAAPSGPETQPSKPGALPPAIDFRPFSACLSAFCGLALCYGAFLFSHPPTAYQFTLVFGVFIVGLAIWRRQWRALFWTSIPLAFGSLLAAAYFYPALLEQSLIHADDVAETWPYHTTYVFDYVQTRFNHFDPFIARLDFIWAFNAVLLLLAARALLSWSRALRLPKHGDASTALWLAAGVFASFLMTRYSLPLGRLIPKLDIGVFAWRMLGLTSLAVALLAGVCAHAALNESGKARRFGLASVAWLMLFAALGVSVWKVAWPMVRSEAFRPNPEHYNFATLPAQVPREVPPLPEAQFANADAGEIKVVVWQPEYRVLQVRAQRAEQLQLRLSDFPGWTALIDGQPVPITRGTLGNITLMIPAGEHRVTLDFRSTPIRRVSNWLTVAAFGLWLGLFFKSRRADGTIGQTV